MDSFVDIKKLGRSLMYNRKSKGPRIDPWGTPQLIYVAFEIL
jgi:hypothetical protein